MLEQDLTPANTIQTNALKTSISKASVSGTPEVNELKNEPHQHGSIEVDEPKTELLESSVRDTQQAIGTIEASLTRAAVRQTDEKTLDVLARKFQQVSRRHRQRVRRAIWLGAISGIALMIVNLVALIVLLQTERYPFGALWWLWILNAFVLCGCVIYPLRSATERRTAAAALASYEDVRVVGPLTEQLSSSDMIVRKSARIALISLLPRLTPSDSHWLNEEQRDTLCRVLEDAQRQPELSEAILLAFAQVGDSSALAAVQRVAEMPARVSRHKRLQAVARQCLPILQDRIHYEGARRTLLRAHNTDPTDSATLLRMPDTVTNTHSKELLRPTHLE